MSVTPHTPPADVAMVGIASVSEADYLTIRSGRLTSGGAKRKAAELNQQARHERQQKDREHRAKLAEVEQGTREANAYGERVRAARRQPAAASGPSQAPRAAAGTTAWRGVFDRLTQPAGTLGRKRS